VSSCTLTQYESIIIITINITTIIMSLFFWRLVTFLLLHLINTLTYLLIGNVWQNAAHSTQTIQIVSQKMTRCAIFNIFYNYKSVAVTCDIQHPDTQHSTLVHALIVSKVDYCNSVLAGIPGQLQDQLQSVLNAAARLVFLSEAVRTHNPIAS